MGAVMDRNNGNRRPSSGWYYTGRLAALKRKPQLNPIIIGAPGGAAPRIVPRSEHPISRGKVSPNALRVLYRLKEAGYQSFLVGGSVRDLLLGLAPKDFDIATDALPEEVKDLFRNCRLIGRRFRLAHVYFGREIVEVATFRAAHDPEAAERDEEEWRAALENAPQPRAGGRERVLDERGRILRDNVYGTIEEDVWRRDFTANALYYNIEDFSVWDYVNGFEDVLARRLRLIGDPVTRYHEDPVRMLRAVRFAAKLGFTFDEGTEGPLRKLAYLLTHVPPARLFDEILKLFLAGFSVRALELLQEHALFEPLLPLTHECLTRDPDGIGARILKQGLEQTDARVAAGKPVTPTFLFALLLYAPIMQRMAEAIAAGATESQAAFVSCEDTLRAHQGRMTIPRRFVLPMRDMYILQPRFHRRTGRKSLALLNHPRFRAAFDLLLLRAATGAEDPELAQWWTRIQTASAAEREEMVQDTESKPAVVVPRRSRRRRRRRPRSPASS
jgi:poly(A) polymerase